MAQKATVIFLSFLIVSVSCSGHERGNIKQFLHLVLDSQKDRQVPP